MVNVNLDWPEAVPHPDDRVEYELWTNSNDECGVKMNSIVVFSDEYVICLGCKSPDTILSKEDRLFFLRCEKCNSARAVAPIKAGFVALVGRRNKTTLTARRRYGTGIRAHLSQIHGNIVHPNSRETSVLLQCEARTNHHM
ncbi:hypothetical protein ACFE04_009410 [Oxalis oulophora]